MRSEEKSSLETPGNTPERVFVYGTLRSGGRYRPQVEHLVQSGRRATIRACMYHFAPAGSRGDYPFIVPGDSIVHGEVLAFSDWPQALAILDRIEGCPALYTREVVPVCYQDGGAAEAQCYFIRAGAECRGLAIESGDWLLESEIEEAE